MKKNDFSIVQIAAYYPPHLGGLEGVAKEVSEQLTRDGHEVTVLTSDISAKQLPKIESHPNLIIKRLWSFEFAHTAWIPGLLWQLLRVKKPTIFHLHLAQAYVPEMVWLASKLRGIPYIVHFHLDVKPSGTFGFIYVLWKKWIQSRIIKDAVRVITLSPDQSVLIKNRYHKTDSEVVFIGNGVGNQFLTIGENERVRHNPLRLLFVGRLALQKRPERLVEAMPLIKSETILTIVGDGEDRSMLEALVKKHNLKNVSFVGKLFGEALLSAYRDSDVFVLPSDREGMPLVLLEAMAAGLPIVASDVLGITELIEGVGVLVANPSPETFAAAIDALASDPAKLALLSKKSFAKAQDCSWEKLVKKLEAVYKEIGV
ncbi:MAG TPA: glycosyltransferase family 4 protein [Candidatus Paceibacterota bacterium]|nr:glycosyltransferase family 4 protein [Candidatus Paceibacterota bacterium]